MEQTYPPSPPLNTKILWCYELLADFVFDIMYFSDSCMSDGTKKSVQRKLEYFSLNKITAQVQHQADQDTQQSQKSNYHSIKYEHPDVPKRAHIQRYLQQLGLAEHPVQQPVKEAWSESPQGSPQSRQTSTRTVSNPVSAKSSPGRQSTQPFNSKRLCCFCHIFGELLLL